MGWLDAADQVNRAVTSLTTFGRTVSYTHTATGTVDTITAPLDTVWLEVQGNGETTQSGVAVVLDVRLADLSAPPAAGENADTVTYNGTTYNVRDIQVDGDGMAALELVKVR